ncbi:DUF695 domain-containing protein [Zobellia galactanivorans]|uniref:DUF695 domain-containing protein n=1 Tax=Zobellia galactanivorans (strain DSM 12802 / CCUG 47099 / CIP 106680 / NCIMB 13871 / Dsij) TaxID=63186 RepID=UPI001C077472|nr:DUF695 domain-containing protein [Zobellia galactanivorans]MBU3026052.1 DUF695 domain-containing protein [Zobellia galactanivorans]
MIALEKIQEIYDHMHSNGVNTDADMLYGYFFTNSEPQTLEKVSELLKSEGFEHVDIYPDDTGEYWLHLERIESHNASSLFELNKTLYAVADKFNLSSYDGFDIGNPDKNLPIERDTYAVPEQFASNDFIIDDLPCLLSANKAFEQFPHKDEFLYFIEIKSKYTVGSASQLPTEEELQDLNDFEIFVENNLTQNKIPNYYVGRTTYNSERTVYLVTNEKEGATGLMDFLKEHGNQRDFEFNIIEDPEWKIYSELMNRLE